MVVVFKKYTSNAFFCCLDIYDNINFIWKYCGKERKLKIPLFYKTLFLKVCVGGACVFCSEENYISDLTFSTLQLQFTIREWDKIQKKSLPKEKWDNFKTLPPLFPTLSQFPP